MTLSESYRRWVHDKDLISFSVIFKESDLHIRAHSDLHEKAAKIVEKVRLPLEKYIQHNPQFTAALEPVPIDANAPQIVQAMAEASEKAGTGPMAAVAGAIAELVGKELLEYSPEVIVENGGDIYIKSKKDRVIGIFAGDSPFTGRLGLEIKSKDTPLGICTSSGTVGHSLSFGKADAVIILSKSTALADTVATATCNLVKEDDDIQKGIDFSKGIEGVRGAVIIKGDKLGVWGDVTLREMNG